MPTFRRRPPPSLANLLGSFNVSSPDEVRWLHRGNSKERVEQFLQSQDHIIEGDIMMGSHGEPVMYHPGDKNPSSMTFTHWLDCVFADPSKKAKLDFKDQRAVDSTLAYVRSFDPTGERIFINADILPGPHGKKPLFSRDFFHAIRKEFPAAVLSPGFTTRDYGKRGVYTDAMIDEALLVLDTLAPPLTIAIRAEFLSTSPRQTMERLLHHHEHTLTVWSGAKHHKDKILWPSIFLDQYKNRVFLDIVDGKLNSVLPR